jgi:UDP-N-acetylglucosamine 2-epimerase (non-hydrolysing)
MRERRPRTILSVIGTRPEAIKMAPVVEALARREDAVRSVVCVTGQHREMLDPVLSLFSIAPTVDLDVMQPGQTLAGLTSRLIDGLDRVCREVEPDWVLVQGDTTTAMAGALVAFYRGTRLGHVEAGLRSGDLRRPFPEELNRRLADLVADAHFAPTARARDVLLAEGVPSDRIRVTGNTVVDALLRVAALPYDWSSGPLAQVPSDRRLVTITAHRRESFGAPFRELCLAVRDLAERHGDEVQFVYPVHLNPRVREPVMRLLSGVAGVTLLDPLDYQSLVQLMKASELVLTDSGGLQEEAPSLGVPVLVMREVTERPEGIEAGVARLVGTDRRVIRQEVSRLLADAEARAAMAAAANPYGDGNAGERVVECLLETPA